MRLIYLLPLRWAFILLSLSACQRAATVSGVWQEVELMSSTPTTGVLSPDLYELNLGQYGDRVAGVSVRYHRPTESSLALFDQADRCNCSFVVQGLIEELESNEDGQLLFVASGLTFSLFTPSSSTEVVSSAEEQSEDPNIAKLSCQELPQECRRIFDLEQVDRGEALEGMTWCLDSPETSRRPIRFEPINGIPENSCEVE